MDGIVIEHVGHSYPGEHGRMQPVLRDVSLALRPGESVAISGESGGGKSTLARLVLGLEPLQGGDILLDGVSIRGWSRRQWRPRRKTIQGVFQDTGGTLNPSRSVYQNMEEALVNLGGESKKERRESILRLMDTFGLDRALLKVPARALSGGEQRRLALLRALSVRPRYLVLDEVTAGLDLINTDTLLSTLEAHAAQYGCTYIMITHDVRTALRVCPKAYMLEGGSLVRSVRLQ